MSLVRTEEKHYCPSPPKIETWGEWPINGFPELIDRIPEGSTWSCDECGRTLVVCWQPTTKGRNTIVMGQYEWREETWRDRWKRLRKS